MISDIDATVKNLEPNFSLIKNLASECRMPLCYSGGIKTVDHAQKIFSLGVEKIAISSAVVEKPSIVLERVWSIVDSEVWLIYLNIFLEYM